MFKSTEIRNKKNTENFCNEIAEVLRKYNAIMMHDTSHIKFIINGNVVAQCACVSGSSKLK